MMDIYTVSFFGHRWIQEHFETEKKLRKIIFQLLENKEYIEFLVGRNGDFDQIASSAVRGVKKEFGCDNSDLTLVLPYATAEYLSNEEYFLDYYDHIEISEKASTAHYKAAIDIRNREMADRSDLIICYMDAEYGGTYQTIKYAKKQGKKIINLTENIENPDYNL